VNSEFFKNDRLDSFPLQILNIHHLGGWHDLGKLRVQISSQHIINLRRKKLIVGKYTSNKDVVFAVFDPQSTSKLNFKNTSTLNISIHDVELALKVSILLKRDKNGSLTLLLKNNWLNVFTQHFYENSSDHDPHQWRNILIDWYTITTTNVKYFCPTNLPDYNANASNYNDLKVNYSIGFIHIENFSFKRGFRNNRSIIVTEELAEFLTYEDHYKLILNSKCFDPNLIESISELLRVNENELIKFRMGEIIFKYNSLDYLNLVARFTANQYLSCATPSEIDRFISDSFPTVTLKFQDIKNDRFKERLIAGRSNEKESYYFDSLDTAINDIIYYAKSYTDFLREKLKFSENIFDLYMEVYNIDENVECLRFWHALNRVLIKVDFDLICGRFSTFKIKDDAKEYMVKIVLNYLEDKKDKYLLFGQRECSVYRLDRHYAFRYLKKFYNHFENSDGIHFDLNISYLENDRFVGYTFIGESYGVGIFPLVFPEVVESIDESYFYYALDSVYYARSTKNVVNLYTLN
jgi:hypothetical protein